MARILLPSVDAGRTATPARRNAATARRMWVGWVTNCIALDRHNRRILVTSIAFSEIRVDRSSRGIAEDGTPMSMAAWAILLASDT